MVYFLPRFQKNLLTVLLKKLFRGELTIVGVQIPGPRAIVMLSIVRPDLFWVSMAKSMGVEAARCRTAEDVGKAMDAGLHNEGPYLIEVAI